MEGIMRLYRDLERGGATGGGKKKPLKPNNRRRSTFVAKPDPNRNAPMSVGRRKK